MCYSFWHDPRPRVCSIFSIPCAHRSACAFHGGASLDDTYFILQGRRTKRWVVRLSKGLAAVEVEEFVGLGCIRYQPTYIEKLSADFLQDANALEHELTSFHEAVLEALTTDDPQVFVAVESPAPAAAPDGATEQAAAGVVPMSSRCIGVLSLPSSPEINSLDKGIAVVLAHVAQACEAEEARKFLETLGHTVKHVINVAEDRLTQSKDDAIYQEGFLRHIPLLGSVVNMVSPATKQAVQGWQWEIPGEILEEDQQPTPPGTAPPAQ